MNASRTKSLLKKPEKIESRISFGANEKLPGCGKNLQEDGCVVLRHGKTCSKMRREMCELANKRQSSYSKSQVLAWMITISRKEELE